MTYSTEISKEELQLLPLLKFQGEICLVDDFKKAKVACREIEKSNILGFDTEKKPTFKKGQYHPTALVQLANEEKAYLFRTNMIGVPEQLKSILESEEILKVGLGLNDDIENLQKISNIRPRGIVDLNDITREMGLRQSGLRNVTGIFLESRISKNQQTSNWENEILTHSQQNYAALDAWVCREIYSLLDFKGFVNY